jgi:hypothetical protein
MEDLHLSFVSFVGLFYDVFFYVPTPLHAVQGPTTFQNLQKVGIALS